MKMLRYQQQYSFFDLSKLNSAVRFINLSQVLVDEDWTAYWKKSPKRSKPPTPASWWWIPFARWCAKLPGDNRDGGASVHPAPRAASDQLGGHDVSDRRICRGGDARQSGVHRRRRPLLALSDGGAEFRRAQAADHETARPGVRARAAHLPHHRRRAAGLLAHAGLVRTKKQGAGRRSAFPWAFRNWTR